MPSYLSRRKTKLISAPQGNYSSRITHLPALAAAFQFPGAYTLLSTFFDELFDDLAGSFSLKLPLVAVLRFFQDVYTGSEEVAKLEGECHKPEAKIGLYITHCNFSLCSKAKAVLPGGSSDSGCRHGGGGRLYPAGRPGACGAWRVDFSHRSARCR